MLGARRRWGSVLVWLHVIAGVVYLVWLSTSLDLAAAYVTIPFFVAEVIALAATTLYAMTIRHPRMHRLQGADVPEHQLSVDVWICTRGESEAVLRPTLVAAMQMVYARKRVTVLDDAGSPVARKLALEFGANYVTRSETPNAKAGSLNHALSVTRDSPTDLILTLDADQVPDPDLMQRLSGYFRFATVGFVASAQRFLLPPGDPFGNADSVFYKVMQASKDTDNAAFSCGSGVVYRRAALEAIGGFSTWNLVEDVHTSMRLHEAGWRSVYYPYPVTTGTAPADVRSYLRQRRQWAVDSLRLVFWDNPFGHRQLTMPQKLQYFYTGAGYIVAGIVLPFYFAIPVWSMLAGLAITTRSATTYFLFRGAYLALTVATIALLQLPVRGLKAFRMWAGAFPVFLQAVVIALRSRHHKPAYRVTSKVVSHLGLLRRGTYVLPQIAVVCAIVVSALIGWHRRILPMDALLVNTGWGAWVVWTLSSVIAAALQSAPPAPVHQPEGTPVPAKHDRSLPALPVPHLGAPERHLDRVRFARQDLQ